MPKKKKRTMTPEQKQAQSERMKAFWEAKKQEGNTTVSEATHTPPVAVTPAAEPSPEDRSADENSKTNDTATLLAQIQELKKTHPELFTIVAAPVQQGSQPGAQVTQAGVVGTTVKYDNPKSYPDPREKLFEEPKLKIQGFTRDWWDLEWTVSSSRYQTKDGLWFSEPKFHLKLIRIVADEDGMPSAKRYVLHKVTLFEDPDTAMQMADQYGITVPEGMERSFLDEMRYLRIRDWVLESFYPPKPSQEKKNKTETVIGNRLVEVYENSSVQPQEVPFNQLNKKL